MQQLQGHRSTSSHVSPHGSWQIDRLRPAAACAGLITTFNAYTEIDTGFTRRRELPDGNATLLFNLGGSLHIEHPADTTTTFTAGAAFYSGPSSTFAISETDQAQAGAQVMLTPVGARKLLGIPLGSVGDALTDPVLLLGTAMHDTLTELQDTQHQIARLAILERAITAQLLASDSSPPADIVWAFNRLRATAGCVSIQALAIEIGCSRKHLTSRFSHEFGMPPKVLARVLRFAHAMRHVRAGRATSWAAIAAVCGYADQSHLAREFQAMAGDTPRALAARALPDDGGFTD